MKFKHHYRAVLLAGILLLAACKPQHSKDEIEASMQKYDRLIKRMDADSIAKLFTPDGDLGGIARGQDSIRKFLASFRDKNIQVILSISTTRSVALAGDTALQQGSYKQTDLMGRDTIRVKGNYTANWQWDSQNGWRISRMRTQPVK